MRQKPRTDLGDAEAGWYATHMKLRNTLLIILGSFAVVGYGAALLFFRLLVATDPATPESALLNLLIFATLFLGLIALLAFLFFRLVGVPIRNLTTAMNAFAKQGVRVPIKISRLTPREIRMLIVTFVDLSERVEHSHARDTEISHVKSDFITTAAHQLRTPLTGIRWALEALEKSDTVSEEQRALIENAAEKSHQLVSIVGTLLNMSSIESGKHQYHFEAVDMPAFLKTVVADFDHMARERSVTLSYKENPHALPPVRADREQVRWVLNNIIENAIRYTPSGGSVTAWADMRDSLTLCVHVRDTGIGIPETDRSGIFERFYRASNAVSKENAGNGLGLYIARTIAADHGGDLSFSANDTKVGTTFTLSLPVAG